MKLKNLFRVLAAICFVAFVACNPEPPGPIGPTINNGNNNGNNDGTTTAGAGTRENPFTVDDVLAKNNAAIGPYWVKGYIVGQVPGKALSDAEFAEPFTPSSNNDGTLNSYGTNVLIAASADVTDYKKCAPVQLPPGSVRTALNLPENGAMLGLEVLVYGKLEAYFGAAGVKEVTYAEVNGQKYGQDPDDKLEKPQDGQPGSFDLPFTVEQAIQNQGAKDNGVSVWVEGYIVGVYGNSKAPVYGEASLTEDQPYNVLIAATADDYATTVCVQLPAGVIRDGVSLVSHAENLGKKLKIDGTLEPYNTMAGVKNATEAYLDGKKVDGSINTEGKIFAETVLTRESFDKFTTYSVSGDQVWTFDEKYGAKMSGYVNADAKSFANEDWFITPAIDLSGKSSAEFSFEHARGPKGSMAVDLSNYVVLISTDYVEGDPRTATWQVVEGVNHGTTAWGYVSSGKLPVPSTHLTVNFRFALKYTCSDAESATWEARNFVVE